MRRILFSAVAVAGMAGLLTAVTLFFAGHSSFAQVDPAVTSLQNIQDEMNTPADVGSLQGVPGAGDQGDVLPTDGDELSVPDNIAAEIGNSIQGMGNVSPSGDGGNEGGGAPAPSDGGGGATAPSGGGGGASAPSGGGGGATATATATAAATATATALPDTGGQSLLLPAAAVLFLSYGSLLAFAAFFGTRLARSAARR